MCGCNAYIAPFNGVTGANLLQNQNTRNLLSNKTILSAADYQNGDLYSIMRWAWCVNQGKVKNAFSTVGLDIDVDDLKPLAEAAKVGDDKAGRIRDRNGNPVSFSVTEVFSRVALDNAEIAKSNCTIQFL